MAAENFSDLQMSVFPECTLSLMPKTASEYRGNLVERFDTDMCILRERMSPSVGAGTDPDSIGANGFSLDKSFFAEFDDLAGEIRQLILNADVRFNAKRQNEIIANCQSALAKVDDKFQRVLARLT